MNGQQLRAWSILIAGWLLLLVGGGRITSVVIEPSPVVMLCLYLGTVILVTLGTTGLCKLRLVGARMVIVSAGLALAQLTILGAIFFFLAMRIAGVGEM